MTASEPAVPRSPAVRSASAAAALRRALLPTVRPLARSGPAQAPFSSVLAAANGGTPASRTTSMSTPMPPTGAAAAARPTGQAIPGSTPFSAQIVAAARAAGVEPALVAAVAQAESSFNPRAVSTAGAKGLMQLMDSTARGLGVSDPFDPAQNLAGGAKFLSGLLKEFGGDVRLALAAYNAGPGAVRRFGGVPPYEETRRYVPKVLGLIEEFRRRSAAANSHEGIAS